MGRIAKYQGAHFPLQTGVRRAEAGHERIGLQVKKADDQAFLASRPSITYILWVWMISGYTLTPSRAQRKRGKQRKSGQF